MSRVPRAGTLLALVLLPGRVLCAWSVSSGTAVATSRAASNVSRSGVSSMGLPFRLPWSEPSSNLGNERGGSEGTGIGKKIAVGAGLLTALSVGGAAVAAKAAAKALPVVLVHGILDVSA